jgi:hypothetical protein
MRIVLQQRRVVVDTRHAVKKEHNPPHIHALYQGLEAVYDIRTAEKIKGDMPSNQSKLISAWIVLHEEELMADWELAQSNESIYKIRPLR